jgi:Cd2+/Zn2+-exporting ATPase/Cu+-exporting ATPase
MTSQHAQAAATLELTVPGIDCADCARQVERAIADVPGVLSARVLLATERALVEYDPARVDLDAIREAVRRSGHRVGGEDAGTPRSYSRSVLGLLGVVFGAVLLVVVLGEWLGLLEAITVRVPWPLWLAVILAGGWPVLRNVVRAAARRQVVAHTLMTVGLLAAIVVGEWAAAAVVVFFMRIGDFVERFTAERARRAVGELARLAPQIARVERDGTETIVPASAVQPGEVVVVRPGEAIAVDGEVIEGAATIDQSRVTGESMPVEVGPDAPVFAASIVRLGYLRVRATAVGSDSTFGRVIRLVEQAEADRGPVQRAADRFAASYLPVVIAVAVLTLLLRRDPLATAAVLVVACSCSFALATPIALLASIGSAARRGLLVKGGRYLETLARADVLLLDKTGTLTLGRPEVASVIPLDATSADDVLAAAAVAEWYSEHPLAEAIRQAARAHDLNIAPPERFEPLPGLGVRAQAGRHQLVVGRPSLVTADGFQEMVSRLEAEGQTVIAVARDGQPLGLLGVADAPRPGLAQALATLKQLEIQRIELLTGDNERAAAALAARLGIDWRANLLPEDKIAVVRRYQEQGHVVVMVGDGINDAPALAQADVGIAMGAVGTAVAIEAAHVVLLREDWALVPQLFRLARRAMRTVWLNLGFTAVYNVAGLTLAGLGLLPVALAAAAQSLPDLFILGNSSRLLRQR